MELMGPSTLASTITKHLLNFPFNFTDGDDEKLRNFLMHHHFTDSCDEPTNYNFDYFIRLQIFHKFYFRNFKSENISEYSSTSSSNHFLNINNSIGYNHGFHISKIGKNDNIDGHWNDDSFNYTLLNSEEQTHADPRQAHNSNDISHASYDEPTASYINTFLLTYIPLIIYIVGVLGNSLSLSVLVRKRMRRVSTYTYLSVMSVVDTLVLTMGLLQLWIGERSNLGWLRDQSNVACKTLNVFSYSMSDLSVWLIIAVTVERFIAVCHPLRAASMCRRRIALKVMMVLSILAFTVNGHFIWTAELKESSEMFSTYEITEEGTNLCSSVKKSRCMAAGGHEDFIQKYWPWVDAIFYSFLPFVVIISLNCMIIRRVMVAKRRRWKMISQSSVSVNRSDATSAHLHQHQLNARFKNNHPTARGLHSSQHRHQAKLTHQSASRLSSGKQASRMEQNETNRMLSIMLLTISFAFILMTLPRNIYFLFVYWSNYSKHSELLSSPGSADEDALGKNISSSEGGAGIYNDDQSHTHANLLLASTLTEMLMFLNHSSNFFLYCATGQKFRMELKKMLLSWRSCLSSALCHLLSCFPSSHTTACKKNNGAPCFKCFVKTKQDSAVFKSNHDIKRTNSMCYKIQQLNMHLMKYSCQSHCLGGGDKNNWSIQKRSSHTDDGASNPERSACYHTVVSLCESPQKFVRELQAMLNCLAMLAMPVLFYKTSIETPTEENFQHEDFRFGIVCLLGSMNCQIELKWKLTLSK
ncbi:hypothetical protein HELRODRAFT_189697 [Helobdella robusta]|uniref:G-protein coupled receptors family 1 profile domain-containing protein n=1 Tax=Helobdella robusta TaxID=6412 RepID=T1FR97_HELRO|nr:hypothetical protein HELRODRAFT_189697 [Helobdella robusta]ESN91454.1 hypothetical protein HELRODRAFT_189697 [Helobdella robusta]